jgi:hypothetical protein
MAVLPFRKPTDDAPAPEPEKKSGPSMGLLLVIGAVVAYAIVKRKGAEDVEREKVRRLEGELEAAEASERKEAAMRASLYDRPYARPWF